MNNKSQEYDSSFDSYIECTHQETEVSDQTEEVIGNKAVNKYKKTISFVEDELYQTLNYLNQQLNIIDEQLGFETLEEGRVAPFNRNVYESKKQIIEQKIIALRSLSVIASDQVKISNSNKDGEITNITDLFQ